MRKLFTSAVLAAGSLAFAGGLTVAAPSAGAINLPPGHLVHAPAYCLAAYGSPDDCPPPDRPDPITDPACLRVDIEPRHCPWLP